MDNTDNMHVLVITENNQPIYHEAGEVLIQNVLTGDNFYVEATDEVLTIMPRLHGSFGDVYDTDVDTLTDLNHIDPLLDEDENVNLVSNATVQHLKVEFLNWIGSFGCCAANIKLPELITELCNIDGVCSVHHLNVWSISTNYHVMSAHVLIDAHASTEDVLCSATKLAQKNFGITNSTIQIGRQSDFHTIILELELFTGHDYNRNNCAGDIVHNDNTNIKCVDFQIANQNEKLFSSNLKTVPLILMTDIFYGQPLSAKYKSYVARAV